MSPSPTSLPRTSPAWKALNTIAFALVIVMNALAVLLPLGGKTTKELSDQYPLLLTPPGYVFSIWSLIYLLLAGFIVYQWTPQGSSRSSVRSIGFWFVLNGLANSAWIVAWHYEHVGLSVLIMLILLASLIVLYVETQRQSSSATAGEQLLAQLPFSIYMGWISVATIVNVSAWLYSLDWNGFGWGDAAWALIGLAAAASLGLAVGWIFRDPYYELVLVWAFIGIAGKDVQPDAVSSAAWALAALLAAWAVLQAIRRYRFHSLK
ncbi:MULTISPECIES: TspO/MBR family protein [unclassified Paenibacillus]|uniref:TspO/MBR family protein n=1 Tax=unclassified Paenibacillus TaxID=185978 RepID=UPI00095649F6|nr:MULTISPECIES: TspO/MBR family protein [unclassified Paenibacillus]ASS68968.1 tryptophan-rich sensory protein [Paenibacillus sp. RUD330]SIR12809.1 TspO and MBR related proteins [Paenibacillus sp. RU4X]SIR24592.1 TspO and MBR related proteins [Paenibacillus sp. RU4T]